MRRAASKIERSRNAAGFAVAQPQDAGGFAIPANPVHVDDLAALHVASRDRLPAREAEGQSDDAAPGRRSFPTP